MVEELRKWLLSSNLIPVKPADFDIDFLDYKEAMSLQISPGTITDQYIGGDCNVEQNFTLVYRSMNTDKKKRVSQMAKLNAIGEWVNSQKVMPSLGEDIIVSQIKCSSTASILEIDDKSTTYQINFNMNYEKRSK